MTYRAWLIAIAICATGCSDDESQRGSAVGITGTAIVDWTIANRKDPSQCGLNSAASIDITVDTLDGVFVGDFTQDCEAFATSIELPHGRYAASAALVDASGADRTTAVNITPFTIHGGDTLTLAIDFPANSFY